MPSYPKEQMLLYRSFIAKILVARPNATLVEIQEQLVHNKFPRLHLDTISKLRNKAIAERRHLINQYLLKVRLGDQLASRNEVLAHAWNTVLTTADEYIKLAAARLILSEEHDWTKLLIMTGILDQGDSRGEDLAGEKQFPAETFDPIMLAIQNNMFRPATNAFKYLPETIVTPKINNPLPDVNTTANPVAGRKFVTLIPVKDDRSFALPPR